MRPVVWVVVGCLACAGLGFLLGRSTASRTHGDGSVASPEAAYASRPWPTVWPDGGPVSSPQLDAMLAPQLPSGWIALSPDMEMMAERIRRNRLTPAREQAPPLEARASRGSRPTWLRALWGPDTGNLLFSGCRWGGRKRLRVVVPNAWETPFGAYVHHGCVHELVQGRWLVRRPEVWDPVAVPTN